MQVLASCLVVGRLQWRI